VLLKAALEIVPLPECNNIYREQQGLTRQLANGLVGTQLCAFDRNYEKDACQGDSGGPFGTQIDERHYLVGITSFGLSCGSAIPGIYTNVTSYLDYIENICWSNYR